MLTPKFDTIELKSFDSLNNENNPIPDMFLKSFKMSFQVRLTSLKILERKSEVTSETKEGQMGVLKKITEAVDECVTHDEEECSTPKNMFSPCMLKLRADRRLANVP